MPDELVGATTGHDDLGLVPPTRIGANGYRYYDARALVRLQRVLLLRELGLGLAQIGDVLARATDEVSALTTHLGLLRQEQDRLARQVAAVEHTITALRGDRSPMAEDMFDGFDHTRHREEVERRWGEDAYARSDTWWRGLDADDRRAWQARTEDLVRDWVAAATEPDADPSSPQAQDLARRHVDWLRSVPGPLTGTDEQQDRDKALLIAQMYVTDDRFAATYGGTQNATFVRDTLAVHAGHQP